MRGQGDQSTGTCLGCTHCAGRGAWAGTKRIGMGVRGGGGVTDWDEREDSHGKVTQVIKYQETTTNVASTAIYGSASDRVPKSLNPGRERGKRHVKSGVG